MDFIELINKKIEEKTEQFKSSEERRQELLKQIDLLTQENFRLQGEYRVLLELQKELKEPEESGGEQ